MWLDLVMVVVPFAQVEHESDSHKDFWRVTPSCLRRLFELNGRNIAYEAANRDRNAANSYFFVGSRHEKSCIQRIPSFSPVTQVCGWLGAPSRERHVSS
jgi:hypothetical protein